ncbi:hypothetical protein FXO38_32031 [Capsicum annuum]|nr:hypothetical protein FXO38_32031 [Capsicum annuum]
MIVVSFLVFESKSNGVWDVLRVPLHVLWRHFGHVGQLAIKANSVVWSAFLAASRLHGNADLAEVAAKQAQEGGIKLLGKVVIYFINTGVDYTHPGFSDNSPEQTYPVPEYFSDICEVTLHFPSESCNRKLVGARHFAASAITWEIFNATKDYASRFDDDGHGM